VLALTILLGQVTLAFSTFAVTIALPNIHAGLVTACRAGSGLMFFYEGPVNVDAKTR
jgi:hypothetical protein